MCIFSLLGCVYRQGHFHKGMGLYEDVSLYLLPAILLIYYWKTLQIWHSYQQFHASATRNSYLFSPLDLKKKAFDWRIQGA